MRQSTPAKFSLHCLGRSVNKKAVGVLIHSHTFQVSIPGQVLSNAPCNLIHTVSQNMIVISILQMNKSILRGLLAQCHITDSGIDLRAFVSSSGLFQTTSPQLSHHLKHLHTSLSIMCLTLFLVRDDFVCATTLKGYQMQDYSCNGTNQGDPEFPRKSLCSQQSVPWVSWRQKAEIYL